MIKKFSHITIYDILYLTSSIGTLSLQYLFLLILLNRAISYFPLTRFCVDICKRIMSPGVLSANENDES